MLYAMVAEVLEAGGLASADLQPRLSSAASAELGLLRGALDTVQLRPSRDICWVRGGPSAVIRASDFYNTLCASVGGPPMADVNWDCFAPSPPKGKDLLLDPATRSHTHLGVPPPARGARLARLPILPRNTGGGRPSVRDLPLPRRLMGSVASWPTGSDDGRDGRRGGLQLLRWRQGDSSRCCPSGALGHLEDP